MGLGLLGYIIRKESYADVRVCVWTEEGGREECSVNWRAKDREIEEVSVWVRKCVGE